MDEASAGTPGSRRNEDIALDLMKFVAMTTGYGRTSSSGVGFQGSGAASKPEDYANSSARALREVSGGGAAKEVSLADRPRPRDTMFGRMVRNCDSNCFAAKRYGSRSNALSQRRAGDPQVGSRFRGRMEQARLPCLCGNLRRGCRFHNVRGDSAHGRKAVEDFHAPMFATRFKNTQLTRGRRQDPIPLLRHRIRGYSLGNDRGYRGRWHADPHS